MPAENTEVIGKHRFKIDESRLWASLNLVQYEIEQMSNPVAASILETLASLMRIRREYRGMDMGKGKVYMERRYLYVVPRMFGTMH